MEVILKPISGQCNMDCGYCYYKHSNTQGKMTLQFLDRVVQEVMLASTKYRSREVIFNWHGGEPLLMGIDFYKQALEYQKKYTIDDVTIINTIQTNGTLLTDEWVDFLREEDFIVGVSLDGPPDIHNKQRVYPRGKPTYEKVMQGISLLQKGGVKPHLLAVIHNDTVKYPERVFEFFYSLNISSLDILPCLDSNGDLTVDPEQLGQFLIEMFDLWTEKDDPDFEVRFFKSALKAELGEKPILCTMRGDTCGFPSILPSGDIYFCDSFEDIEAFNIGNLNEMGLFDIWDGTYAYEIRDVIKASKQICHSCEFYYMCGGGCSRSAPNFQPKYNHLKPVFCDAYKLFFPHVKALVRNAAEQQK